MDEDGDRGPLERRRSTMPKGHPLLRCVAMSKTTRTRCGNAPVRGATVCRFHGANRAVRSAGERRVAERQIVLALEKWERRTQEAAQVKARAVAPWANEPIVAAPHLRHLWMPSDLRRVAAEMRLQARRLSVEATALEIERAT
jgi:hypothetical protein